MEAWVEQLRTGHAEAIWDSLIDRYRRLILSAIRHYLKDPDDVMDVFARVCSALRENDFARLRQYADSADPRSRFSTWLVTVVRHLTVDWIRQRDGRPSNRFPTGLSPLQQRIYQLVFIKGHSHREAFHLLTTADGISLSEHDFSAGLAAAHRAAPASPNPRRTALRHAVPLPDTLPAPAEPTGDEDGVRLNRALAKLSAEDRLAVQLFVIDELAAADVARTLGWASARTVYNRVSRALKNLRAQLQDLEFPSR